MSKTAETTPARFPAGTLAQIDKVLEEGEHRSDFFRKATEREIIRRRVERTMNIGKWAAREFSVKGARQYAR